METIASVYHVGKEEMLKEKGFILEAKKDMSKFSYLYEKYFISIYRYVYNRIGDEASAADLTSQVFLKAMKSIKRYEFRGLPFSSWLYRIASNELNLAFREKKKAKRIYHMNTKDLPEMVDSPVDEETEEKVNLLLSALQGLDHDELELIQMKYFEKRPYKEISEILEVEQNALKVRVHRIKEKIRNIISTK
ncbi:MAG: sigma-70 family RNA polymerase sigma factor [Flavobacteriales bacterium]|nr:sigma-70 family RNA polymerase sigma factor [Flavobacteriales bacterium]